MAHHVLSSAWPREDIDLLLGRAAEIEAGSSVHLTGVVALAFFEDSVRTRVGFEVAALRCGLGTTTVLGAKETPTMSGAESAQDALASIAGWCEAIVLRHPDAGLVQALGTTLPTSLINAGNGRDDHPTQALIDLATIRARHGRLDDLRIGLVGDLDGMRAGRALLRAMASLRGLEVHCASPAGLEPDVAFVTALRSAGATVTVSDRLPYEELDVVSVVGLAPHARARSVDAEERSRFAIGPDEMARLPENAAVLCPLPRVDEISRSVDHDPRAAYFEQSARGLSVRMAILERVFLRTG